MNNVYEYLQSLGIKYTLHEHAAVFTVEESELVRIEGDFAKSKNLFLRNKKGAKHYLVTLEASKQLDLNKLAVDLGEKAVGFASEDRLKKYLDLTPGSVSPFGLINDKNHEVVFVLDKDLLKFENQGLHPNVNTQTIVLKTVDFKKYVDVVGNQVIELDL